MTDYLELLLDEESEEEREPFVWRRVQNLTSDANVQEQTAWADSAVAAETAAERADERKQAQERAVRERVANPIARLAELERAVVRAKAEQAVLNRRQSGMETVRGGFGGEAAHRSADAGASGTQRGLAGRLDAIFERDARRYDGPLGLF